MRVSVAKWFTIHLFGSESDPLCLINHKSVVIQTKKDVLS